MPTNLGSLLRLACVWVDQDAAVVVVVRLHEKQDKEEGMEGPKGTGPDL